MVSVPDRAVVEAGAELELALSERDALINAAMCRDPTDFDRLNTLHDRIEELEQEVAGKSAVKQLILTTIGMNKDTRQDPMRGDAEQVGALQLEPLTMKLFSARWDASFEQPGEKVQLERDFTTDAGYSAEDIERIGSLKVGESWTCPDHGRSHTVTRLLDGNIPEVRTEYIQKYLSPRIPNDAKEAQRVLDGFESTAQVEAGVVRWLSNRQVPPQPVLDLWKFAGKSFDIALSAKVREAELSDFLAQYRAINTGRKPSSEQFAEMRSAFGAHAQPMDIVTGDRYDLEREQVVQRPRMKA
jgi:hypothetical protein